MPMRAFTLMCSGLLTAAVGIAGCAIVNNGGGSDDADGATVCDLADEFQSCPECDDGDATCTFEEVSVTRASCGECQARGALFQQLCDDDEAKSADAVEAGTVCITVPSA